MGEGVVSNGPMAAKAGFATATTSASRSFPIPAALPRRRASFSAFAASFSLCSRFLPSTPLEGLLERHKRDSAILSPSLCSAAETMDSEDAKDHRIAKIASAIRVIPDFPKPGIMFQDITTLLLDPKAFKDTIDLFVERYKDKDISVIAGIEARGFIFGPPIALAIGAKFVPMRKPKKLPGEVISEEYSLEYGQDVMEMHVGAVHPGERALVIDDLIATGGTLGAAIRLLERVGVEVVECACVIELPELEGRKRLGDKPLFVLVSAA